MTWTRAPLAAGVTAAAILAAAGIGALAGSDERAVPERPTPAATSYPDRWTADACRATDAWQEQRRTDGEDLFDTMRRAPDPESARTVARVHLDRVQARTSGLLATLAAPGAPERVTGAARELSEAAKKLDDARTALERADPRDLTAFARALSGAAMSASAAEGIYAYVACPTRS
jgi:hypothetical protein